ncbi:uncharacterized protein K444DRAFT_40849 [Hyaloscypha bicolor E]|uniref:Uncharacterized protein n=1 Tax=Hyaloscypha bicolor E TaxID=1095630 RepID=A0A2J6T1R2_9HELO|nr:uncharacterized protein K444DRAFT_40849 [Hyaloscypha bicolor E]PMD56965.1 hypothetical protein K444DRAFT_40849 [Hyaloscypha bicolor E]
MLLLKKSRKSRTTGRSVEWSGVKCQNEFTKLAGMQGKPGGVGGRVRGRGSDWIGEDGVAPPRHLCFFSSRPVLAQGRGPATQWHVAHSTRACRPAHALPCWLAPSQLFLLPFLHSGPCTQSCSSSHPLLHGRRSSQHCSTRVFSVSTSEHWLTSPPHHLTSPAQKPRYFCCADSEPGIESN